MEGSELAPQGKADRSLVSRLVFPRRIFRKATGHHRVARGLHSKHHRTRFTLAGHRCLALPDAQAVDDACSLQWRALERITARFVPWCLLYTVNRYVDILEHLFLIRKLPPYFANVGKRLVKSPKIYFCDSGLLHYFLGIRSQSVLETHPQGERAGVICHRSTDCAVQTTGSGVPGLLLENLQRRSRLAHRDTGQAGSVRNQTALLSFGKRRGWTQEVYGNSGTTRRISLVSGSVSYSLGSSITAIPVEQALTGPSEFLNPRAFFQVRR